MYQAIFSVFLNILRIVAEILSSQVAHRVKQLMGKVPIVARTCDGLKSSLKLHAIALFYYREKVHEFLSRYKNQLVYMKKGL
jgi:hypothetical protein